MSRSLSDLQKEVYQWWLKELADKPGGAINNFYGLVEEVGELARTIICANQGRKGYDDPAKCHRDRKDAVSDVLIFLMNYCSGEGIDLQEAVNETWDKVVSKRTLANWEEHAHDKPEIVIPGITESEYKFLQNGNGFAEPPEEEDESKWNHILDAAFLQGWNLAGDVLVPPKGSGFTFTPGNGTKIRYTECGFNGLIEIPTNLEQAMILIAESSLERETGPSRHWDGEGRDDGSSKQVVEKKLDDNGYNRQCSKCTSKIHHTNQSGMCPDCYGKYNR